MARLAQILAHHGGILVLDAASSRVQVGLLRPGREALWHTPDSDAGQAVFAGTAELLARTGLTLAEIDAVLFCEGPGSMLGIRTVAMALRTWSVLRPRACFSYQSLVVAARHEWRHQPRPFTVVADARRDSWHAVTVAADGSLSPLQRLPTSALPSADLFTPEHFRAWTPAPAHLQTCTYDLARVYAQLGEDDLFRESASPDAFQAEAPDYRKWSAQVHSAATAQRP